MRIFLSIFTFIFATYSYGQSIVWINEIHYDDDGSSGDTNEGVEIAGIAGTDLSCYDIIPYNGATGQQYTPIGNPSTIIPDQNCGYGAVWVSITGLQNGGPDGIALVNTCTNTIVQFLSYESTPFAATNGPANGMTSLNIGVTESGGASSPIGSSLQINGTGNEYNDFSWSASSTNTMGQLNSSQFIFPCGPINYTCIWTEDFTNQTDGAQNDPTSRWTTSAGNCDETTPGTVNGNYWGVNNGEFRINDIEGITCPCSLGGMNDNLFITENIDISSYSQISISITLRAYASSGVFECDNSCNSEDKFLAQYKVDASAWTTFAQMCGVSANYNSIECIDIANGSNLQIRVLAGNQSNEENYYFDNITVCEAICTVVLPTSTVDLNVVYNQYLNNSEISWHTLSEQNNSHFTLSYSKDGYQFEEIGTIEGAGNSSEIKNYRYIHNYPQPGINYYKLQSTDYDGKIYDKGIVSITANLNSIYYNSASHCIEMLHESDIVIYTMDGKILMSLDAEKNIPFKEAGFFFILDKRSGNTVRLFVP